MDDLLRNFIENETLLLIIKKAIRILIIILIAKILIKILTSKKSALVRFTNKLIKEKKDDRIKKISVKIVKTIIYIVEAVMIIEELGFDLSVLKTLVTGLGLSGVIITLAAQDTAKNLFGGLVLFLDKPFQIGDYVTVQNYEGTVEEITFRSTSIRTLENSVLHIPNSEVANSIITNVNEIKNRRYKTNLILELYTPLDKIEALIKDIEVMLENDEKVLNDKISVKFQNITDNGIEIVVITYLDIVDYNEFLDEKQKINYNIMSILQDDKVELAYNTQTIIQKNV